MLALMLYAEARRAARRDPGGAYVPLEQQDTSLWDDSQIALAEQLLREANAGGPTGRYQLEAAIQSAHVARRLTGACELAGGGQALRPPPRPHPLAGGRVSIAPWHWPR